jgi:hypothetical protein
MEYYFDSCLIQFVDILDGFARRSEIVDLIGWIRLYIFHVVGELAFSRHFWAVKARDENVAPPVGKLVRLG